VLVPNALFAVIAFCVTFAAYTPSACATDPGVPEQFWNMPVDVVSDGLYPSSKLRFDGNYGLAYYSPSLQAILYEEYDLDRALLSSVQVVTGVTECEGVSLGLSYCDKPLITFYNGADHHIYFLCHDTSSTISGMPTAEGWGIKVLDGSSENSSMLLTYLDSTNAQVKVRCMGGTPTWASTIPYEGTPAQYISVAVKATDGQPVVAFFDSSLKALIFAERKGGAWTTAVVDNSGDTGYFCKIRVTTSGEVYIAYQDRTVVDAPVTKVAHKVTDTWTIETADPTLSGYDLAFVLDAGQRPHVLSTDGHRFRYARHNGTAWETLTIPNPVGIDGNVSMHIVPSGKPAVFFSSSNKIEYIDAFATSLVNVGPSGGGGCFVATAAFGSMGANAVRSLTTARDTLFAGSATSGNLVEFYYLVSPTAAVTLRDSGAFRAMFRNLLAR